MRLSFVLMLLIVAALPGQALDDAAPGKSLEGIRLGESPGAACKLILDRDKFGAGWKRAGVHRYANGVLENDLELLFDKNRLSTIEILSRSGTVIQVSRTSGDGTYQTDYSFGRLKRTHPLQERSFGFDAPDGGGFERYYFDDVKNGVCFVGESQDIFFLTAKPDTLIVHKPGVPVLPVTQGLVGKIDTGDGGRVYANQEDYDRQTKRKQNDY